MAKAPTSNGRQHRASYATDKRKGGYLVRVTGPQCTQFHQTEVPVNTKDGGEHMELLDKLIWSGTDKETGEAVALYTFKARPKEAVKPTF